MFASPNLSEHLLRGAIGFGAVACAVWLGVRRGVAFTAASLALGVLSLIALRGCPICWTVGLVETLRKGRAPLRAEPTAALPRR